MCPKHSGAKQTKMLESGAERLAAGSGRESRQFVLQRLKLSHGFDGRVFIGTIWGEGCRCGTVFWLVGGEMAGRCFRNLTHQPFGSDQSGVHVLELSLKLPSCPWAGTFGPIEELRDIYQMALYIPWGGARTLLYCHTKVSWLSSPHFCIHSLTSLLVTDWICPLEFREDQGGWNLFLTNKKHGTQKGFGTQEGSRVSCLASTTHTWEVQRQVKWGICHPELRNGSSGDWKLIEQ